MKEGIVMRALLLDASPSAEAPAAFAGAALAAELTTADYEVETLRLRELNLRACTGCFGCWTRTPGQCVIDDDGRTLAEKAIAADVLALSTPVRFGTYGSVAKSAWDRLICLILPQFVRIDGEVHHRPRYDRYPSLLVLGTLEAAGASAAAGPRIPVAEDAAQADAEATLFTRLVSRNALNFHSPSHGTKVLRPGDDPRLAARELVVGALTAGEVAA